MSGTVQTPASTRIRILLVDDHIVMRMGLATAANGEPDMVVVAEAENGRQAVTAYGVHQPDVVVLDLRMPGPSGTETIRLLRDQYPGAKVLVFSSYGSGDEVFDALTAGASGFVLKEMPLETLLTAIRAVYRGDQYIPPEVSARISGRVLSQLSSRELDVLKLAARGYSNKEIGSALNVVEGTVKLHVKSILSKLQVSDRTQAILVAVKRGIIQIE
jgi:DNA-binding NarL/FixJ family response regulator